jgi:hypothetical protein
MDDSQSTFEIRPSETDELEVRHRMQTRIARMNFRTEELCLSQFLTLPTLSKPSEEPENAESEHEEVSIFSQRPILGERYVITLGITIQTVPNRGIFSSANFHSSNPDHS